MLGISIHNIVCFRRHLLRIILCSLICIQNNTLILIKLETQEDTQKDSGSKQFSIKKSSTFPWKKLATLNGERTIGITGRNKPYLCGHVENKGVLKAFAVNGTMMQCGRLVN